MNHRDRTKQNHSYIKEKRIHIGLPNDNRVDLERGREREREIERMRERENERERERERERE